MDRRSDVGSKIAVGVSIVVIAGLLMAFFTNTRQEAILARSEAQAATIVGVRHGECLANIEKRLDGIDKKLDTIIERNK